VISQDSQQSRQKYFVQRRSTVGCCSGFPCLDGIRWLKSWLQNSSMSPIRPVLRFSIRLKKWEAFIKDVYPIVLNVSSSFCSIDSPPAARATPSPLSSQRWHSSNSFGFHLQQNNN
jgi:hypothetical protein